MERLGLSDDELLRVLDADPLTLIAGELDHRPELPILLALDRGAAERVGEPSLPPLAARERARRPPGRPPARARLRGLRGRRSRHLAERGFVIRRRG